MEAEIFGEREEEEDDEGEEEMGGEAAETYKERREGVFG